MSKSHLVARTASPKSPKMRVFLEYRLSLSFPKVYFPPPVSSTKENKKVVLHPGVKFQNNLMDGEFTLERVANYID